MVDPEIIGSTAPGRGWRGDRSSIVRGVRIPYRLRSIGQYPRRMVARPSSGGRIFCWPAGFGTAVDQGSGLS